MAALAAFIVSDENSFMTGSTIVSDGGFQVAARPPSKGEQYHVGGMNGFGKGCKKKLCEVEIEKED